VPARNEGCTSLGPKEADHAGLLCWPDTAIAAGAIPGGDWTSDLESVSALRLGVGAAPIAVHRWVMILYVLGCC
jgi:hypothetical protein